MVDIMIEWVMVRCSKPGMIMSMSGISDRRKMRGRLTSCFRSFAEALAKR